MGKSVELVCPDCGKTVVRYCNAKHCIPCSRKRLLDGLQKSEWQKGQLEGCRAWSRMARQLRSERMSFEEGLDNQALG